LLPASFFELRFLEINLAQWIALILLVVAVTLVSWLLVRLIHRIVRPLVARTNTDIDDRLMGLLDGPLRLLLASALFAGGALPLRFAEPVLPFLGAVIKALVVLAVTWVALRLTDVVSAVIEQRLKGNDRESAIAVLPLARRSVKSVLIALAVIGVLQNLGVNVTGLIAGLGVGGLAVALAAQKTLANLFGGVTLVTDQPVRVGDFCRFGDGKLGVIEKIGLRSTRVRTLDRTLITVPNSEFSEIHLENFAARDRIRLITVLGLRYETTADQLRFVLAELRKTLLRHPRVLEDPARVRFVGFGAHSLDLEVLAYLDTNDWNEFLKIREDLFLRFMDVVAAAGTGFAFPSQTLYLGRDTGLDRELSARAKQTVQGWRTAGELPFPDFSDEPRIELQDSGEYPPPGSATR
jgi:MscS family membrane protein